MTKHVTRELRRTSLHEIEEHAGAKFTRFGEWNMVQKYGRILDEARAVREQGKAVLFNASHMGEFLVSGPGAPEFLDRVLTNNIASASEGKCIYSPMCYENGGTVDDVMVHKRANDTFMLVVNAANTQKDWEWLREHGRRPDVTLEDVSGKTALLALQGEAAERILQKIVDTDLSGMKFMQLRDGVDVRGARGLVSRTGYTGADGFEIAVEWNHAPALWQTLMDEGEGSVVPAGLTARNIARIEAGLPLYGHELSERLSPLDAGLNHFVVTDPNGKDYVGKDALLSRTRLRMMGLIHPRGVEAREDGSICVLYDGTEVGFVSSSCLSPTVQNPQTKEPGCRISIAFFRDPEYATPFTEVALSGKGGREVPAEVTALPFIPKTYRR